MRHVTTSGEVLPEVGVIHAACPVVVPPDGVFNYDLQQQWEADQLYPAVRRVEAFTEKVQKF